MAGILKARKKHSLLSLARSVKIISAGKDFVWNSSPLFLAHLNQRSFIHLSNLAHGPLVIFILFLKYEAGLFTSMYS